MNKKEIDAYQRIQAPNSIKEKILGEIEEERRRYSLKAKLSYAAVAAAAVLIIAFLFYPSVSTDLYYNGEKIEKDNVMIYSNQRERAVFALAEPEVFIPFEVKTSGDTKISVKDGYILSKDGENKENITLDDDTEIIVAVTDNTIILVENEREDFSYGISKKQGTNEFQIKKIN